MLLYTTFLHLVLATSAFPNPRLISNFHQSFKLIARVGGDPYSSSSHGSHGGYREAGPYQGSHVYPNDDSPNDQSGGHSGGRSSSPGHRRRKPLQPERQEISEAEQAYLNGLRDGHLKPRYDARPDKSYVTEDLIYPGGAVLKPPLIRYRGPPVLSDLEARMSPFETRGKRWYAKWVRENTRKSAEAIREKRDSSRRKAQNEQEKQELERQREERPPVPRFDPAVATWVDGEGLNKNKRAEVGIMDSQRRISGSPYIGVSTGASGGGHFTPYTGPPNYYGPRSKPYNDPYLPHGSGGGSGGYGSGGYGSGGYGSGGSGSDGYGSGGYGSGGSGSDPYGSGGSGSDPYGSGGRHSRYRKERRSVSDSLAIQESHAAVERRSPSANVPFSDPTSEFQFYAKIYSEIQANVSDLLFPYFDTILNNTNSSLIYDLVWSVYSDLVADGPYLIGPYSNGMHCFDWIEAQLLGDSTGTNVTYNETVTNMLADHAVLIDIYTVVWGNATQIANQTGYLSEMDKLRTFLNPVNSSIIPASWNKTQPAYDLSYFTIYNETMHI